jgi:hypothetical protein
MARNQSQHWHDRAGLTVLRCGRSVAAPSGNREQFRVLRELLLLHSLPMQELEVLLEVSATRSFACALWFPGWFGQGKSPDDAIEGLLSFRSRFAPIAKRAKRALPSDSALVIVERQEGNGTTQFGAPGQISDLERDVDPSALPPLRALHQACRDAFDDMVASAPAELRKGPRGGGRDTAKVVEHVLEVEQTYASRMDRGSWPEAYYLRRSGYHYTGHAWEIEDRSAD